jgi:hypothetical protein
METLPHNTFTRAPSLAPPRALSHLAHDRFKLMGEKEADKRQREHHDQVHDMQNQVTPQNTLEAIMRYQNSFSNIF